MDRQLPRIFIALLQNWLDIMLCLCSLGIEARYHTGIWYCECELGRRVITSFVCDLIYYTARYLAAAQCIVIGPVCGFVTAGGR